LNRNYILIAGHGRSGTNFLLRLLDFSGLTHCRNEPDQLDCSVLRTLSSKSVYTTASNQALDAGWDNAVALASQCFGIRDGRVDCRKEHVYELIRRLGGCRIICSSRIRSFLSILGVQKIEEERRFPWWLGPESKLLAAVPVVKINQMPGWAAWVSNQRPEVRIIHIIRHPGGYLASWKARYLKLNDREAVGAVNRQRLEAVLQADPSWHDIWGDCTSMTAEESELWYWRYAAETIHAAGRGKENYRLVVYEELASRPLETMNSIYEFCGLPWSSEQESMIGHTTRDSQEIATAWHQKLSPEDHQIVSRILTGTNLQSLWKE
jgi:hypothetical protein